MKRIAGVFALATMAVLLTTSEASAACGPSKVLKPATLFSLQGSGYRLRPSVPVYYPVRQVQDANEEGVSIVGLWDVQFQAAGALYDEGLDVWHSDGTEIMNDLTPPAAGNVCVGVWVQTGPRMFSLRHPFWIFDVSGTTVIGRGTVSESVRLNRNGNSYTGTFSFVFRDLDGNPFVDQPALTDISGELFAKRITVF
jgi:hypothetical protein